MKFAARLSKLFAGMRTPAMAARSPRAAKPAPLIVALEPRIVYDASAASIGAAAAAAAQHHAGEQAHGASAARDAAATPAALQRDAASGGTPAGAARASGAAAPAHAAHADAPTAAATGQSTGERASTPSTAAVHGLTDAAASAPEKQVVFIDSNVSDYQTLIAGLPPGTQYVMLDSTRDGLAQIAQYLEQHPGVGAIHLVSHGADGEIQVGSTWLNAGDLSAYSAELAQIGAAMKPGGDLLIYGCDVAEYADGKALVQQIASISGLNVAASTDATGAAALGGDWVLEYDAGTVHTPVVFSQAAEQQYGALLGVTDETYDTQIGYVTSGGANGVTSFSLDGITYTMNQPAEFAVDSTTVNQGYPPPLSTGPTDGVLFGNIQSSPMTSMTMALQNGDKMTVQSFDIDLGETSIVSVEALDASGNVLGTVTLNTASNGGNTTFHVDLSSNAAFAGIQSLKFVETDGNPLLPTLNNFAYVENYTPPLIVASGGSTSFVAGDNVISTPVRIDSAVTLTDTSAATAKQGTVSITGNFVSGEDMLGFTGNASLYGDITGSYNAATGVMTLTSASGTATIAQWQSAFRAVTYTDTAVTPYAATRTMSFELTSDANSSSSNTVTKTVTVTDTDQTPIVTTTGGTTIYRTGTAATTIDSRVTVSDLDNSTQASGTVSIGAGFHIGDTLSFTNTSATSFGNITVQSYNAATGVLTLTSTGALATDAQWAHALSAVTFSSTSASYGNRTISFATSDGIKTSVAATDVVDVVNPVQVSADPGSASFVAGDNTASTPVVVDSGLTVSDSATGTLSSATIAITGNYVSSQDVLLFTNNGATMGDITGTYNGTTGVLTLTSASSTATLAQWQSVLDSVQYANSAVTPNNATRTVSFTVVDSLGNTSTTASRTVTVADTDQTPIVTTTGGTTSYVGGATAVTIDGSVRVSDLDNTTQASGTVAITSGFQSGDTLSFSNDNATQFGNITAVYDAGTGVLTLASSGAVATNAQWASALSAVTFSSTSTTPGNRTISFATSDGVKTSAASTDTIDMTGPPVVTTDPGSAAFVAGDNTASTPVAIDSGLTVTDGGAATLGSATVAITGNFHSSEDRLSFTNDGATMGNITGSYNAATGVLTLTSADASATLAQWQGALRAVTYTDTAITPNVATRTISFSVIDGANNASATATRTVTVADTDQSPVVHTTGGTTSYVGGTSAVQIDGGITVTDLDNTTQSSATVSIGTGFHSGDTLSFTNTGSLQFGNIFASYNSATGVLTMVSEGATSSDAQWANALSAVQFSAAASATPGNRTIQFVINDGTENGPVATDTVAVLGPPTITTDPGSASFVAGDNVASTPVTIDSGLNLTDSSAATLASASVAITGNFHGGEDVLAFTNTSLTTYGNIAASYNASTGVLTLTSSGANATLAQWQNALQAVTFTDTAITPNNATRTISFTVVDTSAITSNTATRTVTVTDTDQTPIVTTTGGTTKYAGGTQAMPIDGAITVTDRDNATQASATVSITSGFNIGDTLSFTNTSSSRYGNIVASYDSATGVLTLTSASATATDAQWSEALSAVTFSASASATPGNRTIAFVVNDGIQNSAAASDMVDVTAPPTLTTDAGSASFVAGDNVASTPVTIDPALTLTDGSASTLASVSVALTGNFHGGEDVLGFTNDGATMGNISAAYNATTGVLTLSSTGANATLAQWQAALRSVTYTDTAVTPNAAMRTVSFTAVDGAGVTSNTATRTVTVADTDQTPITTTTGTTKHYVGGTAAVAIDSGIAVTDRDNATQASATVSITSGFNIGDTLSFTNTNAATFGNIVASYDSATGVLTLSSASATATDAQWSEALSAVTFSASASATPGNRTISFTTSDGTKSSAAATDTVALTAPPTLTTDAGSASFVAGDNVTSTPVTIDPALTLTDGSASTLASVSVALTGNFHSGEDVLGFTNDGATMGNISAAYNATTGVLTLSSTGANATLAQWQAALRSVTYTDTAVTPNAATRTMNFTAVDGAGNTSNSATRTVTVADTDQTPITTTTGATKHYVGGTAAVAIDSGITVTDRDNATQASATVSITSGFNIGDTLSFMNTNAATFGNIVASYDSATGVLTLTSASATATDAQWSEALSAVTFSASTGATPGNRTISFVTSDGTKSSAAATDTVALTAPPTLTTDAGSASFVAGDNVASTPVTIDPALTLTDGSASTLASVSVALTGNFHSGEDVLAFTNDGATMGNIAAAYNATTGVLTLSSTGANATLAQWQAALRSVTYTDTAVTPNAATRTVSFTAVDGAGNTSNSATRTVTVADTDQTPIVTATGGAAHYVAGAPATVVNPHMSVTDLDNGTQSSATVAITGNFHGGEDVLAFTNTSSAAYGNISASYDAATGVLTLRSAGSSATDAQWANALSAVTFASSGSHFDNRTISFATNDGTRTSAAASATVIVLDRPHVGTDAGSASFVAADNAPSAPVVVSPGLTLADASSTTLTSATVAITGGFHGGEDVLAFTNDGATMGDIVASYDASAGVLTLHSTSGRATFAQWRAALASVTYADTAVRPDTTTRVISFTVTDGNGAQSSEQSRSVTVADTDQTPLLSVGGSVTFISKSFGTTPVAVAPEVALSDRDPDASLTSAQVTITTGFDPAHDTLAFAGSAATTGNITASYNASTGVLTLSAASGTASLAQWQAALQSVTYADSAQGASGSRTVTFSVSDGVKHSALASNTITIVAGPSGGSPTASLPSQTAEGPMAVSSSSTHASGSDNTAPPYVLDEFDQHVRLGSVPVVPTITFSDPNATHIENPLNSTTVPRFDAAALDAALAPAPLPVDVPVPLPQVSLAVRPDDPFSIDVATLLPPSVALHGTDLTVRLADGRTLPGWIHYDAANGVLRGKLPPGAEDVRIVVRTRDAAGHETRREIVLAPHRHGGAPGGSHGLDHPKAPGHAAARTGAGPGLALAAGPAGKPSLDQQFERARAALHVTRPGAGVRRV
ncbi:DUF4347 domain-containing protein [Paraburkholderia pallida]|uniref:DUF4347 domain-containing protein n=1 Tax=Paraburkholderia pallida TaxID=2547399 RepID=A0A4V1B0J4_9BURK|nr:DUF4347 domain-containing protein [Paraburkholderia pallida]QBR02983.1 DUF4347 domain-containing protein [Paraburkholderia pallida]